MYVTRAALRIAVLSGAVLLLAGTAAAQTSEMYDVVLSGGRVMDPAGGTDAVLNVGIRAGRIAAVSGERLQGMTMLEVVGKVVAPGFIDLHAHGQTNRANEFQAHDGVTTALEMEGGVGSVAQWLEERRDKAMLNYGATVSHAELRIRAMRQMAPLVRKFAASEAAGESPSREDWAALMKGNYLPLDIEEIDLLEAAFDKAIQEGALGIGMPHQYYPGASREEIFRVFEMAAQWRVPIFTHVRSMGIDAMQEVIANAAATGAALHIVHANSSSLGDIGTILDLIGGAQRRGIDVTTEVYPYTAASTSLQSAIFDEGWQARLDINYGDLQWQDTGERLTEKTFKSYREQGGVVIIHMMKADWIRRAIATPFVMIASDGMPYAPGAHPRSAGTFSRVLGRYVREEKVVSLMDGLAKMTIMPAGRLEPMAPGMKSKGRLQVGADADITVFDPGRIVDTATFEKDLSFSEGVVHVLVNGILIVKDGKTVPDVLPGKPILNRLID